MGYRTAVPPLQEYGVGTEISVPGAWQVEVIAAGRATGPELGPEMEGALVILIDIANRSKIKQSVEGVFTLRDARGQTICPVSAPESVIAPADHLFSRLIYQVPKNRVCYLTFLNRARWRIDA